jgi:hypothetical protein
MGITTNSSYSLSTEVGVAEAEALALERERIHQRYGGVGPRVGVAVGGQDGVAAGEPKRIRWSEELVAVKCEWICRSLKS